MPSGRVAATLERCTQRSAVPPTPTPAPPHITGIVGVSRTKKGLTAISLGFDEAMDGGSIVNPAFYNALGAVKKRGKTSYIKPVSIRGISFDGNSRVTIKLAKPYKGAVKVALNGRIQSADGGWDNVQFSAVAD